MAADDERQARMFENDEWDALKRTMTDLLEAARIEAAALREAVQMQRNAAALVQQEMALVRSLSRQRNPQPGRRTPAPRGPWNPRHRTWREFVLDMQRLEAQLPSGIKPTKQALAMLGSDSARTITRTMRRFGLPANDWPPSHWNPDVPPAR
jgi:hypothetical protein